ncbi:MAG: hypothetical protein Q9201_004658 [Fulgogasparrea decipioides]
MADTPSSSPDEVGKEASHGGMNVAIPFEAAYGHMGGKTELAEDEAYDKLGFNFSPWKKWLILSIIFVVQCSMNFNASVYGNVADALVEEFHITGQMSRVGQAVFLIAYAFGCEVWAPWSEEFGRRPVLQMSLGLVNVFQLPCALARNYGTIITGRVLGGLASAGGSVTLGMVADMWEPDDQQYAVAFIVLSSVGGSVLGPVFGAFIQKYMSWQWIFWWQLIFGAATQSLHFLFVPETRATILLDREAKRRRMAGKEEVYGPNEMKKQRLSLREVLTIWYRPFEMFVREPIVLFLSLLSGFSDALIFTFLVSYGPVFKQWGFGTIGMGLAFIPLLVGYFIAYFLFLPSIRRHNQIRKKNPDALTPEARLYLLLWTAPLETIGLVGFAITSQGPPRFPSIAPLLFSGLIAIANVSKSFHVPPRGNNATGRTLLLLPAGTVWLETCSQALLPCMPCHVSPLPEIRYKVYTNIPAFGKLQLVWPTVILGILASLVTIPIFVFYWKGPAIRAKSKFAQSLASDRKAHEDRRRSTHASVASLAISENADKET